MRTLPYHIKWVSNPRPKKVLGPILNVIKIHYHQTLSTSSTWPLPQVDKVWWQGTLISLAIGLPAASLPPGMLHQRKDVVVHPKCYISPESSRWEDHFSGVHWAPNFYWKKFGARPRRSLYKVPTHHHFWDLYVWNFGKFYANFYCIFGVSGS